MPRPKKIRGRRKLNWQTVGVVGTFFGTVALAIATGYLAYETKELATLTQQTVTTSNQNIVLTQQSIEQSRDQYKKLNRPLVVVDKELEPAEGIDRILTVRNIGNTAANDVSLKAYFLDPNENIISLIFQGFDTKIGILYPDEYRSLPVLDPRIFLGKPDDKFHIDVDYRYLDECITYKMAVSYTGSNWRL